MHALTRSDTFKHFAHHGFLTPSHTHTVSDGHKLSWERMIELRNDNSIRERHQLMYNWYTDTLAKTDYGHGQTHRL